MTNSIYNTKAQKSFTGENIGRYSGQTVEVGIEENDFFVNGGILHQTRYSFFCGVRRIGDVSITEDERDHRTVSDYGFGKKLLAQYQYLSRE